MKMSRAVDRRMALKESDEPRANPKLANACLRSISAVGDRHPEPVRPDQRLRKLRHERPIALAPSVVTKDGAAYRSYTYDANGNRLTASEDGGAAVTAIYDAQDRLTSYGSTTYAHNAMGQLASTTSGGQTATYGHDELGNLVSVDLPSKDIAYAVDGQGRRVAKKVDGTITNRWVYGQGIQPSQSSTTPAASSSNSSLRPRATFPT
jgi:YD repeat-containing protein